jgi:hypothetical protein
VMRAWLHGIKLCARRVHPVRLVWREKFCVGVFDAGGFPDFLRFPLLR